MTRQQQQDKQTFREIFDLLQELRQNGDDPERWRSSNKKTVELLRRHDGDQFYSDLVSAVYNEIYRQYDRMTQQKTVKKAV